MYVVVTDEQFNKTCAEQGLGSKIEQIQKRLEECTAPDRPYIPGFKPLKGLWFVRPLDGRTIVARYARHKHPKGSEFVAVYLLDVRNEPVHKVRESADELIPLLEQRFCECRRRFSPSVATAVSASVTLPSLPLPPPLFGDWPSRIGGFSANEYIFESPDWTERLGSLTPGVVSGLFGLLRRIADAAIRAPRGVGSVKSDGVDGWRAYYATAYGHVYCLDIVPASEASAAEPALSQRWNAIAADLRRAGLSGAATAPTLAADVLGPYTARAYPSYLLADEACWQKLVALAHSRVSPAAARYQQLALSAEEIRQLDELLRGQQLPCFIEGRAGSGKSTILFYFLSSLVQDLSRDLATEGAIGFVTHSSYLRDAAAEIVRALLSIEHTPHETTNMLRTIQFETFPSLALKKLPPAERARFGDPFAAGDSRRIDHVRFRDLYTKPTSPHSFHGQRAVPWQIAWHVIRTYIKGSCLAPGEPWMDPDTYNEVVPAKHRTVTTDQYQAVFEKVWPWYASLTDQTRSNPFWDDTDLARHLLAHRVSDLEGGASFFALVCDEAQDFALVEVMALLRLLRWATCDLTGIVKNGYCPLPFVLAGDPLQTVNPAGFRWGRAHLAVQTALAGALHTESHIKIHRACLTYNYRNPPVVAKGANAIQMVRSILFPDAYISLRPQRIWHRDIVGRLGLAAYDDPEELHVLEKMGAMVIVPNRADAEAWLKAGEANGASNQHRPEVMTPFEAKGLEYPTVVLLNFGEAFVRQRLDAIFRKSPPLDEEAAATIVAQHFFNALYVAFTRATADLFIVDTKRGIDRFWKPLRDFVEAYCRDEWVGCSDLEWDEVPISSLEPANVSPVYLAQQLWANAMCDADPVLANQAAALFQKAGNPTQARICKAHALYWEGNAETAADMLASLPAEAATACQWYWEAGRWDAVNRHGRSLCGAQWRPMVDVAGLLCQREWDPSRVRALMEILTQIAAEGVSPVSGTSWRGWRKAAVAALAAVSRVTESAAPTELGTWCRALERLLCVGGSPSAEEYAALYDIAYAAARREDVPTMKRELFAAVKKYGEASGKTNDSAYRHAVAELADFPENIALFWDAKRPEDALAAWARADRPFGSLPDDVQEAVLKCYWELGRVESGIAEAVCDDTVLAYRLILSTIRSQRGAISPERVLADAKAQLMKRYGTKEKGESRFVDLITDLVDVLTRGDPAPRGDPRAIREVRTRWIRAAAHALVECGTQRSRIVSAMRATGERHPQPRGSVACARRNVLAHAIIDRIDRLTRSDRRTKSRFRREDVLASALDSWLFVGEFYYDFEPEGNLRGARKANWDVYRRDDYPQLSEEAKVILRWLRQLIKFLRMRRIARKSAALAELLDCARSRARTVVEHLVEGLKEGSDRTTDEPPPVDATADWRTLVEAGCALLEPPARSELRATLERLGVDQLKINLSVLDDPGLGGAEVLTRDRPRAEYKGVRIEVNLATRELVIERLRDRRMAYFSLPHRCFSPDSTLEARTIEEERQWEVVIEDGPKGNAGRVLYIWVSQKRSEWLCVELEGRRWRTRLTNG